ncbi:MAG TPA: aldehyde dehydrogenase family protein [Polyangiaceae bacterium]|nr:aldehyde dehydrogenase family protein [Polyangiaceae bacterium]
MSSSAASASSKAAASATGEPVPSVPLFIGGEPVVTGEWLDVMDPAAPRRLVGRVAMASEALSRRAVEVAAKAAEAWGATEPRRRAEILIAALDALEAERSQNAALLVSENGKVRGEAEADVAVFAGRFRLAASLVDELSQPRRLPRTSNGHGASASQPAGAPPFRTEITELPLGVVSIIVPFNWPLAILSASLPFALVAGNAVIVKAPPTAPLALTRVLTTLASKLPPGVLSVVSGSNQAVAPLITDPRVGRLVFTGSTSAGKAMMQMAANNLTRVTLELGGNDPALVLEDADLDRPTLERLARATFLTTGQVCMAVKRIYVHRSRYDELVSGLSDILAAQRIGAGSSPTTTMGPLNSSRQRDYVSALCAEARAAGHEVRELGTLDESALEHGGHFLRPALVLDPAPNLRIVTEEQFGPAVPVLPYANVDAVIGQVNSEWSGLGSSVWSRDLEHAGRVASKLRAGTTWINNASAMAIDDRAPFGGFRQSGVGRELGSEGLREFTEPHTVTYPA